MCFAIRRGQAERLDPKFIIHGGHQSLRGVRTATFGSLCAQEPDYGGPYRAVPRDAEQHKYIRVTDFDDFGIPDGHEYVAADGFDPGYVLEDGDVLFARSGATAGKTFIYTRDIGPAIFAGYCIRFRFDANRILPRFAYLYTKTDRYAAWVRSIQRPSGQPNINKEEFKSFTVPLPDPPRQKELVAALDAARGRRKKMLADAGDLLAGLDGFVLDQLGLTLPPPDGRMVYAARLGDGVRQRADPLFHTPRYRELQRRLARLKAEPLGGIAKLSEERQDPSEGDGPNFRYIEISSVSAETGEAFAVDTSRAEAPSRARMVVHDGNIVVSLTRPQRGSIALIDKSLDGCIASTGFAVLCGIDGHRVKTSYLWAFLRTQAARLQMLQRSSGGNYPAITEDELKQVVVPIPDGKVQTKIAVEVARRRAEARRLRADAETLWDQATADFETALLGPGSSAARRDR